MIDTLSLSLGMQPMEMRFLTYYDRSEGEKVRQTSRSQKGAVVKHVTALPQGVQVYPKASKSQGV